METHTPLVPITVDSDTRNVAVPASLLPHLMLNQEQSDSAHGTHLHALKLLEAMMLSGRMTIPEMLKSLETLAKYQFQTAALAQGKKEERSVHDILEELDKMDG